MEHRGNLACVACVAHGGSVLMDGMAALALFSTRGQNVRHGPRICSTYSICPSNGQLKQPPCPSNGQVKQPPACSVASHSCPAARACSVASHNCPETLPHDAQLGAVVFQPRMRCQRLGATVVARQVQKEEAWRPYQLGYFGGCRSNPSGTAQ